MASNKPLRFFATILFLLTGSVMSQPLPDLKIGDVGTYAEMMARPNPQGYPVVPVPSLVSTLLRGERLKGSPLTEQEVLRIRDRVGVIVLTNDEGELDQARGYKDIDPKNCWQEWQIARLDLDTEPQR